MIEQLGRYALVREIGRGGMSVVYEASDTRLSRTVAVKVLTVPHHIAPTEREALIARLQREARVIGRLSHPNIVGIYDVGEEDAVHYLVMEYLDGVTLRERLRSGPLTQEEALDILDAVAAGLDAIHSQGILHRDVKPSNVMLLPSVAGERRVKLLDFGVARTADEATVTHTGMMVGSPAYMAPELIHGDRGTVASDVWALGVLFYEMVAGRPPFSGESIPTVLYRIAHEEPAPIEGASSGLTRTLGRALAKSPKERFASAGALAQALREAARPGSKPAAVLAPAGTRERTRAGGARRAGGVPLLPVAAAAGSLVLLVGILAAARVSTRPERNTTVVATGRQEGSRPSPPADAPRQTAQAPRARPTAIPSREAGSEPATVTERTPPAPRPRSTPAETETADTPKPASAPSAARERAETRPRPPDEPRPRATADAPAKPRTVPDTRRAAPTAPEKPATAPATPRPEPRATARRDPDTWANEARRTIARQEDRELLNDLLAGWIAATNARDVDRQVGFYVRRLDNYYQNRSVPVSRVRADKARVFGAVNTVRMRTSAPDIEIDGDGDTATMRFRKDYVIGRRSGAVLQELRWRREGGAWKIASERDVRVLSRGD